MMQTNTLVRRCVTVTLLTGLTFLLESAPHLARTCGRAREREGREGRSRSSLRHVPEGGAGRQGNGGSIPPGRSEECNAAPEIDRPAAHAAALDGTRKAKAGEVVSARMLGD